MKIIIQAGGLGTRMKNLTSVKPKSLVSAKYMPIIFHLFKKYPNDEFIIIGDYKFDVLDRYLATFAKNVNYMLIRSIEKGNAAGIKDAVSYIPANEPFMIIWSDIILSDVFAINEIKDGCQVGIADFPCSWSLVDGKLEQIERQGTGVAGLYVFNNKSWFGDFPRAGSFTEWLQANKIPLTPISLMGSIDVGTLEAYKKINSTANRCRPYNRIEFIGGKVVKTGLTAEAIKLIEREVVWYRKMSDYGFNAVPKVYATDPLTLEYIDGTNIFLAELSTEQKRQTLDRIISTLSTLHGYETAPASAWDMYTEYFGKTIHRLQTIQYVLPFGFDRTIRINGKDCVNILYYPHLLRKAVLDTLMNIKSYVPIHGDCQLSNTMIDREGKIYFIDARGYFGKSQVLGDARYDWAKVYYAIWGNFDQFNVKNFDLEINGAVNFSVHSGGWEHLTEYFLKSIPVAEANVKEIKLIHAIIWLSLASHAWEDFDSMCVAFYDGIFLFSEWLEDYGDSK
ncbi:MAG: phosphotransferase [Rickettsiales bacterium]|jgi:GTP:adenosylcobinamide-phosphate guanylyltransferase|nr:phosphotransferase [Rickettsiales bacterium]